MKIIVKNIKGEKKEIQTTEETIIQEFQKEVEKVCGVPMEQQRLIHKGKNLNSQITIKDQGIQDEDCVILMMLKTDTLKKKEEKEEVVPPAAQVQQPIAQTPQPAPQLPSVQSDTQNLQNQFLPSEQQKEDMIKELMSMGFDRQMVEQCLEAAFYDQETAADYLLNGIPEDVLNDFQSQSDATQQLSLTPEQAQILEQLRDSPELQQIRQQIQTNPELLNQYLSQLAQTNPDIVNLFQQNPNLLIALLSGGMQIQRQEAPQTQQQTQVHLTQTEMADINEMMSMGFSQQECLEAYLVCDKNKEQALNFLLDGKFNQ